VQDIVLRLVVPPYPYCIEEDCHDVDLEDCWTALPQLILSCHLRPKGRRKPKDRRHKTGPHNLRYNLVFFSTFEELTLPIKGPMEDAASGVVKLHEPSPTPCLYVALAWNMLCRIPLMPCFLDGNTTLTIPHTSTARTRIHVSSSVVVQTQQRRMAGVAATSMRSTRGCGSLDVASLAWAA
jgi:hypothetical protein